MSHTGSVIHPNRSPGLIRVITVGYALSKENQLVFATPLITGDWNVNTQERFIIFPNSEEKKLKLGDAVKFNLMEFKPDAWKHSISQEELDHLKDQIPDTWKKKNQGVNWQDFKFKYIATEIEELPDDFILLPLYKFVQDFDPNTTEKILDQLQQIHLFEMSLPLRVNMIEGDQLIKDIVTMESSGFDAKYGDAVPKEYFVRDYKNEAQILKDLKEKGQHIISTETEIPTRIGRL